MICVPSGSSKYPMMVNTGITPTLNSSLHLIGHCRLQIESISHLHRSHGSRIAFYLPELSFFEAKCMTQERQFQGI